MQLKREFFKIIPDNDEQYLLLVESVINSIDENSIAVVTKTPSTYLFRISPSTANLINSIISSLNQLHNTMHLHLSYGKSMKNSGNISFSIDI